MGLRGTPFYRRKALFILSFCALILIAPIQGIGKRQASFRYKRSRVTSRGITERLIGRLGQVVRPQSPIFASPGRRPIYYECKVGDYLVVSSQRDGWYGVLMIDGRIGWIASSRVRLLDYEVVAQDQGSLGENIVQTAFRFRGIPYKWGGVSPAEGMDCSAFVRACFALHGINLPRTSREQFQVGIPVRPQELQPGDRLYFAVKGGAIDHTGIYIGNGSFIHSSASRGGVAVDSLMDPKYAKSFVGARR